MVDGVTKDKSHISINCMERFSGALLKRFLNTDLSVICIFGLEEVKRDDILSCLQECLSELTSNVRFVPLTILPGSLFASASSLRSWRNAPSISIGA